MKRILLLVPLTLFLYAMTTTCHTSELHSGDKAPKFTLPDQNGTMHSLSELKGKKVALYFYPADNTPGCTKQACSIRDNFDQLQNAGITIFGVSTGDMKKKKAFVRTYHLPFPLLFATNDVLDAYGVRGNFWRLYYPKRHTFLINEDGIIVAIITNVDVKNHAQQILNAFKNI